MMTTSVGGGAGAMMANVEERLRELLALDLDVCGVTVALASTTSTVAMAGGPDDAPRYETLQMSQSLADEFRAAVARVFYERRRDATGGDLVLHSYDAESAIAAHEVEWVDLARGEYAYVREQLAPLAALTDLPLFGRDESFLAGLRFYVVVVQPTDGLPVYCFRTYTPKKELSRSHGARFAMMLSGDYYDRVKEPIFLFDRYLDCVGRGDDLYLFSKDRFQRIFRFFDLVRRHGEETLAAIAGQNIIANVDQFAAACRANVVKLAKLRNVAAKPYFSRITIGDIKKVIERYGLGVDVVSEHGHERVVYDPRRPWDLLNLLDDNYLESLMTGENYEANSKRPRA